MTAKLLYGYSAHVYSSNEDMFCIGLH